MADFKKEVEAILFAAGRVVTLKELQKLLHLNDPGMIKETMRELKEDYDNNESPLMIISEGDDEISGWKLTVREKMLPLVHKINPHTELSKSILETLAVITWKQPIVQSDVIRIRTNKAYDHIAELLRLGFIAKKRFGRSYSISVTQKFLDYFDLKDNKEIKEMFKDFKDVEVAVNKKKDDLEKAAPEDTPKAGTEESVISDEKSEENISEEGIELEPYIDVLPEATKPKKQNEVEVYERSEEDVAHDLIEDEQVDEEISEDTEQVSVEKEPEETAEEKARRLARELIEEETEAEEEDKERERQLHPELEDFIASSVDQIKPKGAEDHSSEITGHSDHDEDEDDEEGEVTDKNDKHEDDSSDKSNKPKSAEEFPGQFDSEDGSDEDKT